MRPHRLHGRPVVHAIDDLETITLYPVSGGPLEVLLYRFPDPIDLDGSVLHLHNADHPTPLGLDTSSVRLVLEHLENYISNSRDVRALYYSVHYCAIFLLRSCAERCLNFTYMVYHHQLMY